MSNYKNINLITYKNKDHSAFLLINQNGQRDSYFDYFIQKLINRGFKKSTIELINIKYINQEIKLLIFFYFESLDFDILLRYRLS